MWLWLPPKIWAVGSGKGSPVNRVTKINGVGGGQHLWQRGDQAEAEPGGQGCAARFGAGGPINYETG